MKPRLVTYAHDAAGIATALAAGADHLIIDDARVSVRSFAPSVTGNEWHALDRLAAAARFARADVRLSLNVDRLCRDEDLDLVAAAVLAAHEAGFDAVRLQDAGLGGLVRELAPQLALELATEMGNCCRAAVAAYVEEGFDQQVLGNDWALPDLQQLLAAPPCRTELLVHGPVLLQYSDRRQISAALVAAGATDGGADPEQLPPTGWRHVRVEGRSYGFADNRHGSFMYNTFDRSLFPQRARLAELPLDAWLIDGRGQEPAYLQTALAGFAALRDGVLADDPQAAERHWQAMDAAGERPFKPGFFLANNTDRCFDDLVAAHDDGSVIGEVIDVIRQEHITVHLRRDLDAAAPVLLRTPEGHERAVDGAALADHRDRPLPVGSAGDIVRLPWVKGAVPTSTLRPA